MLAKFFHGSDRNKPKKNFLPKNESRNIIVSERQLRLLLLHCPQCGSLCGDTYASSFGVDVDFFVNCKNCSDLVKWSTQPDMPSCGLNKGNLDVTASVVTAGNTYEDLENIASNLNLQIMSDHTFYE